jgi:preprotein translocase subunit SecA
VERPTQAPAGARHPAREGEKYLTGDYIVDEKQRTIGVTDEGWETIEKLLGIGNIADAENWDLKHYVETGIKAHALYKRDVEYVVKDGEVIIVDTFTGRLMPGRRWSDGLHQSIEAKEGVNIRKEDQTLATITFQNYFRLYKKLSGMTGTAETEAAEFEKIYKLEIVVIPTNKPMLRLENPDVVYRTEKEKYKAVADDIATLHEKKQPVLVGTTSIEKSERLSGILQRKGVRTSCSTPSSTSAKRRSSPRPAAWAWSPSPPTWPAAAPTFCSAATRIHGPPGAGEEGPARAISVAEGAINPMAPAGFLRFYYQGQEFEVSEPEWAEVKGARRSARAGSRASDRRRRPVHSRHRAPRVAAHRQPAARPRRPPGRSRRSRFYLSLEDDLMRIFAKQWVSHAAGAAGHGRRRAHRVAMISKRIEGAQKAVEAQNFESRKHLLEYDDVMNKQREAVYGVRRQLLEGVEQRELILEDYVGGILSGLLDEFAPRKCIPTNGTSRASRRSSWASSA